ncbi:MAG: hypothetical protein ACLGIT_04025 [Gammaproteobacteria bacterium]|uniref:hypothetical protein n=1 Tax=Azohydromonas sp. TaxID=1872666 RepID=UPI002B99563B|nr:hypothetical protein [Azohydromonas sp.]HMM84718.1 hypothetical protein [Azohydromonas sp.]
MSRPPVLPSRHPLAPTRTLPGRAAAAPAGAVLARTPVLQHTRTPLQLSFSFHRG